MRFEMTGTQPIRLSTGAVLKPGCGVFEASLPDEEVARFERFGCIRRVDAKVDKAAGDEKVVAESSEQEMDAIETEVDRRGEAHASRRGDKHRDVRR